jgi:mRNA interferase RelE/StbE
MYKLYFEKQANKDLYAIEASLRKKILLRIQSVLLNNPLPNGYNPKKLKNVSYLRFRIGNYRVLYTLKKTKIIIYAIKHRKDVYKNL